jgi:PAS domain S-box-containing protein
MFWLNKITDWAAAKFNLSSTDPFENARLKLSLHLTLVFSGVCLLYAFSFLYPKYYLLVFVSIAVSVCLLLIPATISRSHNRPIFYGSFLLFGAAFECFLTFGSGSGTNMAIIMWQIFIVHLTFSTLDRKVAITFGVVMVLLILLKESLLASGISFPFWIPSELVMNPRAIDTVVPTFFNFYLAYISNKIFAQARLQLKSSTDNIVELGSRLKESEQQYRQLVENSLGYITVHDLSGNFYFVNRATIEATGFSREELLNMKVQEFLMPDVQAYFQDYINTICQHGRAEGIMKVKSKDNRQLFWYYRNVIIEQNGSAGKVLAYGQDISEVEYGRQQLRRQEQEMQVLISSLHDVVLLFDNEDKLRKYWSQVQVLPADEMNLGKPATEIFRLITRDSELVNGAYDSARQGGQRTELVVPMTHEDQARWIRIKISPINDAKIGLSTSVHLTDVTEKKNAELAIQQKDQHLNLALKSVNLGIWDWDIGNSRITFNDRLVEMIGYVPKGFTPTVDNWLKQVHPEDRELLTTTFQSMINGESAMVETEYRVKHKDGRWIWILDRGKVTERDEKGKATRASGTHLDTTERKEAELANKRKQEKLLRHQACLNSLSLSDWSDSNNLADTFGTICEAAAKAMEVTRVSVWLLTPGGSSLECKAVCDGGYLGQYQLGQQTIFSADEFPVYFNALLKGKPIVVSHASQDPLTHEFIHSSLLPFDALLNAPIFHRGKLHGIIGLEHIGGPRQWDGEDISFAESLATLVSLALEAADRKAAQLQLMLHASHLEEANNDMRKMAHHLAVARQKAEESDRLKSMFLANMSHEIRTPMNAIMGFSELLEVPDLSEIKRAKFAKLIRERSKDLLTIINDILDISKIEAGKLNMVKSEGNTDEVLDKVLTNIYEDNRYLQKKKLVIKKVNRLDEAQRWVRLDFGRLYQVLTNLLTNAVKFTEEGTIEVECLLAAPRVLQFTVRDTGVGIAAENREVIFKPFRQAGESVHVEHGGSGLGLAICKGLVDMWGGRIWVESELGKGSTFHFTIPFKLLRGANGQATSQAEWPLLLKGKKVLIIEDDKSSRDYFMELALKENMIVHTAGSATAGLLSLHSHDDIELILLDIGLPDKSGIGLTRELMKEFPHLKIIIVTAFASLEMKEDAIKAGAVAFMTKPLSPMGLVETIKDVLAMTGNHSTETATT